MSVLDDLMKSHFFKMATAAILDLRLSQSLPAFLRGTWELIFFLTSKDEKSIKKPTFRLRGHESAPNDSTMTDQFPLIHQFYDCFAYDASHCYW